MQAVTSSLTRQLDEMNNKLSSNSSSINNQFKGLPQIIAGDLSHVLLAEQGGHKTTGSNTHQLAMSCYNIAEAMAPGAIVAAPNGQMIGKLDYYQAAANLSPHTKLYWLKIAENLGDDEKIKVGRQTYSRSECLSRSEPLPAMALWSQKAKQGQTSAQQGGCAEYMQNRHSEGK
ncbi:hypothetical protein [Limnobacter alexandrii]|jgi:hypothetical protein|uniref:hypothetical protein n=1 Tax=Limnobacter alexandrii TaxID=2570352 RepID=UPI00110880EA|nr:hypothetical protein [Limnobacter alexandrii]